MKKIYVRRRYAIFVLSTVIISCYVSPSPIYRLTPLADNTFWLFGQEYTKAANENIELAVAFERMIDEYILFGVEINNISDRTILISPENFYFFAMDSIDAPDSIQKMKIFAVDPETKLQEIDREISLRTARYKSESGTDAALSLLDLVADISTIGKEKSQEEIEQEDQEDADREESKYVRDKNYKNDIYNLNAIRDEWELSTIRKTSLLPNTFMQGRVYFPFRSGNKYIKICIPVNDDLLTFTFLVERQSI